MRVVEHGLGRLASADPGDHNFPARALVRRADIARTYRYWNLGTWQGDQGATSRCVDYASLHWLQAGPAVPNRRPGGGPYFEPGYIYGKAQLIDEFPGVEPAVKGTSVRAGAKVMQAEGLIGD